MVTSQSEKDCPHFPSRDCVSFWYEIDLRASNFRIFRELKLGQKVIRVVFKQAFLSLGDKISCLVLTSLVLGLYFDALEILDFKAEASTHLRAYDNDLMTLIRKEGLGGLRNTSLIIRRFNAGVVCGFEKNRGIEFLPK